MNEEYAYLQFGNASQIWHLFYSGAGLINEGFNLTHSRLDHKREMMITVFQGEIEKFLYWRGYEIVGYGKDSSHIKFEKIKRGTLKNE